jgi:hypothetical protein
MERIPAAIWRSRSLCRPSSKAAAYRRVGAYSVGMSLRYVGPNHPPDDWYAFVSKTGSVLTERRPALVRSAVERCLTHRFKSSLLTAYTAARTAPAAGASVLGRCRTMPTFNESS